MNLREIRPFRRKRYSLRRIWYFRTRYTPEPVAREDYTCPPPTEFIIEIGNVCNLRCPGCPTGRREKGPRGMMTYDEYRVIFHKVLPYAVHLHLFNWGEPFLNKDLLRMITLSTEHGIATHLDSNLTVRELSADDATRIVKSGLTRLIASIDGASQAVYEKYRVGGDFARAVGNLKRIQQAKERLGSETPVVAWKFLIHAFNEHEMGEARAMADEIGVPIFFDLMDVPDESWRSSLHHKLSSEPGARTKVEVGGHEVVVADYARPSARPVADGNAGPQLPRSIASINLHPQLYLWCLQPFRMMVVNFDGTVYPCCNVIGDAYSLGNLHQESVEEIWNNARYKKCREFLLSYGPRQHTGAICETLPCPVQKKFVA